MNIFNVMLRLLLINYNISDVILLISLLFKATVQK